MFSTDVKLNYVSSKFNSRIPNKKGFCIDPFILTAIFAISIRYYFIRLVYSFFVLSVTCLLSNLSVMEGYGKGFKEHARQDDPCSSFSRARLYAKFRVIFFCHSLYRPVRTKRVFLKHAIVE